MDSGDRTLPTHRIRPAGETTSRPGRLALQILDGPLRGETLECTASVMQLGRSALADLHVDERSISSLHCELSLTAAGVHVRDLGSTNGLRFAGRKVAAVELEPGDAFAAGSWNFQLTEITGVEVEVLAQDRFGELRGSSSVMRELYRELSDLAATPLDVLVLGETGTGKELVAQTLHRASGRKGPLTVLDCASLSPSLAEGVIFGHCKGAFTGATRDQQGIFEAAHGGTLFIDEVGELPLDLQPKLLRALETRTLARLGKPDQQRSVDVRVVAATHRDLRQSVVARSFREDLYYRLARSTVRTPALRDRGEDRVELAEFFLAQTCRDHGLEVRLGPAALALIRSHPWPGNVRELRNAIERAAHTLRRGEIGPEHLRVGEGRAAPETIGGAPSDLFDARGRSYRELRGRFDKLVLTRQLEIHGHNVKGIARALSLSRDTLRTMLDKAGLYARSS